MSPMSMREAAKRLRWIASRNSENNQNKAPQRGGASWRNVARSVFVAARGQLLLRRGRRRRNDWLALEIIEGLHELVIVLRAFLDWRRLLGHAIFDPVQRGLMPVLRR